MHPFGGAPGVAISGYWPGWDIARKIVLKPGSASQGWVLDGHGALHSFAPAPASFAPPPANFAYPTIPARDATVTADGGGQVVTGFGSVARLGADCISRQRWPGWDIVRGFAATS
jgi:hypothetical protein